MAVHPELEVEQAHVDRAYAQLESTRAAVSAVLQGAYAQTGTGTPQAVTERDVSVRTALARLEQLQVGDEPLVFGRIDTDAEPADREAFHIGRLAVAGEQQEPLVVDWRARVAEPFYRATGRHPMGLSRRRHFLTSGRRLTDIEDELFGTDGDEAGLGVGGSTVLLAALERSRSGRMRDIVATVQGEQDEVIRSPLAGILVVQGGPGTGKTAVALHRAAYLLYTHRFPLEQQGVLVVGPNPLFLRYIEHVLPSLGESGVELSTIGGLARTRARGVDRPAVARIKGDARMARVLAKAVADRQRPLPAEVRVGLGGFTVRLSVGESAEIVAQAKRRAGTHNARRRVVETLVAKSLLGRLESLRDRARGSGLRGWRTGTEERPADELDALAALAPAVSAEEAKEQAEALKDLRRHPDVALALDRMWPVLTAEELLHDLFGARALVDLAGRKHLDEAERAALHRRRSATLEEIAWEPADLALLDEARHLLGPAPHRRSIGSGEALHDADEELRTFGHIVVDEAQDLTPMQLRMLARRSLNGSMTIVGDIAQATGPVAPRHWADQLAHLPTRRGVREVELSVNYRTPAPIMELAGRVLAVAAPWLVVAESVRGSDELPRFVAATDASDLPGRVAAATAVEAEAVGEGNVAVLCPPSLVDPVLRACVAAGIPAVRSGEGGDLDSPVTVLPVGIAKGLEFDAVVVVEPALVVDESPQGLRALFVALTRPTRRLAVVHALALPAPLLADPEPGPEAAPDARPEPAPKGDGAQGQLPF